MNNENHLAKCLSSLANRLHSHEFADVVAAWRGPDGPGCGGEVKARTTAIIRRVILDEIPGWEKVQDKEGMFLFQGALVAGEVDAIETPKNIITSGHWHFYAHIEKAAVALGIKVERY